MILYPNAKINLGLSVVRKREDGYHDLETVFLPVPELHDELEINRSGHDGYTFKQEGILVDCPPEKNLIIRVYKEMKEQFPGIGGVDIRFRKNIPYGAGLGGGSADAALMAVGLSLLFDLDLTSEELEKIVAPLGADCAFFVQNRPRFAEGIGNVFTEVPDTLMEQLHGKWLLLMKPDCAVSTAAAYKGIHAHPADVPLREAILRPISEWQDCIVNDFEASVFPQFPEIAALKQMLLDKGAVYAAMSGSGASVFGIFDEEPSLDGLPDIFCHISIPL